MGVARRRGIGPGGARRARRCRVAAGLVRKGPGGAGRAGRGGGGACCRRVGAHGARLAIPERVVARLPRKRAGGAVCACGRGRLPRLRRIRAGGAGRARRRVRLAGLCGIGAGWAGSAGVGRCQSGAPGKGTCRAVGTGCRGGLPGECGIRAGCTIDARVDTGLSLEAKKGARGARGAIVNCGHGRRGKGPCGAKGAEIPRAVLAGDARHRGLAASVAVDSEQRDPAIGAAFVTFEDPGGIGGNRGIGGRVVGPRDGGGCGVGWEAKRGAGKGDGAEFVCKGGGDRGKSGSTPEANDGKPSGESMGHACA